MAHAGDVKLSTWAPSYPDTCSRTHWRIPSLTNIWREKKGKKERKAQLWRFQRDNSQVNGQQKPRLTGFDRCFEGGDGWQDGRAVPVLVSIFFPFLFSSFPQRMWINKCQNQKQNWHGFLHVNVFWQVVPDCELESFGKKIFFFHYFILFFYNFNFKI